MKHWKITISSLFITLMLTTGVYVLQVPQAAAMGQVTCDSSVYALPSTSDAIINSNNQQVTASAIKVCAEYNEAIGLYNRGVDSNGKPLTSAQLTKLNAVLDQMDTNYDNMNSAFYRYKASVSAVPPRDNQTDRENITGTDAGKYQGISSKLRSDAYAAASQNEAAAAQQAESAAYCSITSFDMEKCIKSFFGYVAYIYLSVVAWMVGICGKLFDYVLTFTVVDIKKNLGDLTVINQGWVLFRDVGNFIFIFVLVYIAIRTILGLDNGDTKILIRNVIIIGLLVNFSLFFTKFLIDISNVFSLVFYNKMLGGAEATRASISEAFTRPLGIQQAYGTDAFTKVIGGAKGTGDAMLKIAIYTFGGSLFLIFVGFSFLYASILFLIRYLALIFIMVVSPLAFFAYVIPATNKYFHKWKDALIGMVAFAPLYLLLMFFTLAIANRLNTGSNAGGAFGVLANPAGSGNLAEVFMFIVIIGLINAAAILATKVAASSGGLITSAVNKARGYALPSNAVSRGALASSAKIGRGTVGRVAASLNDKDTRIGNFIENRKSRGTFPSRFVFRNVSKGLDTTSKASFDARNTKTLQKLTKDYNVEVGEGQGKGGYRAKVADDAKKLVTYARTLGGAKYKTIKEIKKANSEVARLSQEYSLAVEAGNETEKARIGGELRTAKKTRDDKVKERKKQEKLSQATYINDIGQWRNAGAGKVKYGNIPFLSRAAGATVLAAKQVTGIQAVLAAADPYHRAVYKDAIKQFVEGEKPEKQDKNAEAKAKAEEQGNRIKDAFEVILKSSNPAAVATATSEAKNALRISPKELKKLPLDVFIKKDSSGNFVAKDDILNRIHADDINEIIKNDDINREQKAAINDYLTGMTTPGGTVRRRSYTPL